MAENPISGHARSELFDGGLVEAAVGVVVRPVQIGRDGCGEYGLRDPVGLRR
jgi:hypothetical protein